MSFYFLMCTRKEFRSRRAAVSERTIRKETFDQEDDNGTS